MAVIGSIAVEYLAQGARAFIQANKEAAASIAEVESKAKSVRDHLRGIVAPLSDASKTLIRFGDGLVHTGQILSTFAYRLMLITAPLAKFVYEVGQAGTELETTMAMIATQLDKGEQYIARFTQETTRYITDLSTEFPLAADDIARAMYFLVSSMTVDPEVARSMLQPIATAAVAGRTTAEEAAKAAVVIMNVYDLISDNAAETAANLEHVYDVIFEAVKKGRAEYADIAVQLGDFVQFAKQAGATFEEAMALFAMATRVTTPSQAATWIANLYRTMITPKFAETMEDFGIALTRWGEAGDTAADGLRTLTEDQEKLGYSTERAVGLTEKEVKELAKLEDRVVTLAERIAVLNQRIAEQTDKTKESTRMSREFSLANLQEEYGEVAARIAELTDKETVLQTVFVHTGDQVRRSSIEILKELAVKIRDTSDAQQLFNDMAAAFPRIRSMQGFLIFLENLTEIEEWTESFTDAIGTTEDAFDIMVDTVEAKLTILKNVFIAIGLDVFETYKEDLKRFLEFLADALKNMREMDPALKKQLISWSALLLALGPIALVLGTILMGVGSLITMLGALISPPVLGAVIAGFMLFGDELRAVWDVLQGISWKDVVTALLEVAVTLGLISRLQAGEVLAGLGIELADLDLDKMYQLRDGILGLVDQFREIKQVASDALAVVRTFLDMVADRVGVVGSMVALLEGLAGAFAGLLGGRAPEMGGVETETWAKLLDLLLGLGIAIKVLPALFAGLSAVVSGLAPLLLGIVGALAGLNPLVLAAAAAVGILFVAFGDWAAATEVLSDIFGPLIVQVQEFIGGLVDAFYEGGLEGAIEYFKTEWSGFAEDMRLLIGEAADKSLVALGDFSAGWLAFLQENAPIWAENVKTWLVYVWETAIGWLGEHVPEWTGAISKVLEDWIQGAIQYVGDNYQQWGVSIAEFLGQMVGHTLTFLTVTLPTWIQGLVDWWAAAIQGLIDWVGENWEAWALALGQFLWDMAVAMVDFQIVKLPELIAALLKWFYDMWDGFIKGLVETGPTWLKQLISWFRTSIWDPFVTALETNFSLVQAGKDLIGGLISGIKAKATEVVSAMVALVTGAVEAARARLDEHSESQVFRAIGLGIPMGLVQGIQDGIPAVQQAMGQLISGEALESTIEQMREFVEAFAELVVWYDDLWDDIVKKSAIEELELIFGGLSKMAETLVALSELADLTVPSLEELFALLEDLVDRMAAFVIRYDEMWDKLVKKHAIEELGMLFDVIAGIRDALEGLTALTGEGVGALAGPAWHTGLQRFFDSLDAFISEFVSRAEVWREQVDAQTVTLAGWVGETVANLTATVEPLIQLADYGPDQAAFRAGVDAFFANLEYFLDEFAWGMWRFEKLATEKAASTAELCGRILGGLGEAIQPLLDLGEYAPGETAFKAGVDLFFANLEYFLDEFAWGLWRFKKLAGEKAAGVAKLMEEIVGALGSTIQPLLDLAEYSVTPAEFARAADLFFDHLARFIEMFAVRAEAFDANVSKEVAGLAETIGKTMSGIGAAVQPLIDITEYAPEVEDIEARFKHFFYHLGRVLYYLEEEAKRWQVSDAAKILAEAVAQVTSDLSQAVRFLRDCADYGTDNSAFALLGFIHFLDDLKAIILMIAQAGSEMVDTIPLAEAWAVACREVLANIQQGIDKLNELTGLGVAPENLVEAGKRLIQSLTGGMQEEESEAISALIGVLDNVVGTILGWANSAGFPVMYAIGQGLINSIIAGLWSQASALYNTVWAIVQAAIAAAEAAAEMSSPSRRMWRLGEGMLKGLIGGIESQRAALARTLAALADYGGFSLQPALAGMGAGTQGGEVVHHHYEYNISPHYEQVQSPADLRRDIEALDWARRHYRV